MSAEGIILEASHALEYIFAGAARVTLRSKKTGNHFTYEVKAKDPDAGPHFVRVHGGEDNWLYIGTVFEKAKFRRTKKSVNGDTAPSFRAFEWALGALVSGAIPETLEVWHSGTCGRCGRELTDPESIARGLGPVCAGR